VNKTDHSGLLAVDVGNSRLKLGWYAPRGSCSDPIPVDPVSLHSLPIVSTVLPQPDDRLELNCATAEHPLDEELLRKWLKTLPLSSASCLVASVQRTRLQQMLGVLSEYQSSNCLIAPHVLRYDDLPMIVRVDHPEQVGIDRLLCGITANHLRSSERAATIVDMGSAITVDRVAVDGAFEGGAILPGLAMSARALQSGTDLLPRVLPGEEHAQPCALGKNTSAAITAGLYWGVIGAIRELVRQQMASTESPCELFITGGDALRFAAGLQSQNLTIHYQEQMVLTGIWIVAQELS
jgi:type III pantothenate kinase